MIRLNSVILLVSTVFFHRIPSRAFKNSPMLSNSLKKLLLLIGLSGFFLEAHSQCSAVDFSANSTKGCAPLGVTFTATNVPTGATIEWNLGGGYFTGTATAFRYFTNAGKVDIELRITEAGKTTACKVVKKSDYIEVLAQPDIDLDISDTLFCDGNGGSVVFEDKTAGVTSREWIFNGVTESSTSNKLTKSLSKSGIYSLNLKVKNSAGCESLFKKQDAVALYDDLTLELCGKITEDRNTKANFWTGDQGNPRKATDWEWTFSGGVPNSSTAKRPKGIKYKNPVGTNSVSAKVTYEGGCVYTRTITDYIRPFISVTDTQGCVKEELPFTNLAPGNGRTAISMGFPGGDLTGDPEKKFKISYGSTGFKTVTYGFQYSNHDSACKTEVVLPDVVEVLGPKVNFFSNQKSDCNADSVLMQSISSVPATGDNTYTWRYFDTDDVEITGSPVGPTKDLNRYWHKFPVKGVYSVELTIKNSANGCENKLKFKDYLRLLPPKADLIFSTTDMCVDNSILIEDDTEPKASATNKYKYKWVVKHDDSANIQFNAISQNFSRTLVMPGTYSVNFTVDAGNGCTSTLDLTKHITVKGLLADLTVDKANGCPTHTFDVDHSITLQYPAVTTPTYTYDWGVLPRPKVTTIKDSTAGKTQITVTKAKCYKPQLEIRDNSGCIKKLNGPSVCIGAVAGFAWDPDSFNTLCLNKPLAIQDESEVNPVKYRWYSDNPNVEFLPNDTSRFISLVFKDNGTFNIKQVVYGEKPAACKDSITKQIVIDLTKAKFKIDKPLSNCAPEQLLFTNESDNALKFKWFYGDGKQGIVNDVEHKYIYTQNNVSGFTPKLVAYSKASPNACTDTFKLTSKVKIIGPEPEFRMDTTQGCDSANIEFYNFTSPLNATYVFDYGDGNPPVSNDMKKHKYVFNGQVGEDSVLYFPTIVATSFGCDAYFSDTIVVYRSPEVSFKLDTNGGCKPLTVTAINESKFASNWQWDFFNDGVIDSTDQDTVKWTINKTGRWSISLHTQRGACKNTLVMDTVVGVSDPPKPRFTLSDSSICDSQTIRITNTTFPTTATFIMDYGDGSVPDTNVIKPHLYQIPATHPDDSIIFTPTLHASALGCNASFANEIIVYRSPKVDFDIDSSIGCQPFQISMTNKTDRFNDISWDLYNDGNFDHFADTFNVLMDTVGYFDVRLRASYIGGCVTELVKDSFIWVIDTPIASFIMNVTQGCDSLTVDFTNTTTPSFTDFLVDFGDGNVVSNPTSISHTYRLPNGFTDDSLFYMPKIVGKREICPSEFMDSVLLYKSPEASFSIDTSFGCQPLTITLLNTSTPVFKTEWDLYNDGVIDSFDSDSVVFIIDSVGDWDISLFTEYRGGCTSTRSFDDTISVWYTPVADLTLNTIRGCDSLSVSFTSGNLLDSFIMDYGNTVSDTNILIDQLYKMPTSSVPDTLTFFTTYQVFNPDHASCTVSQMDTVNLFSSPIVGFKADTLKGCAPLRINFEDTTRKAFTYEWDFNNDGIIDDTIKSPDTLFNAGKQTIGLIIVSEEGCSDTLYKQDYITSFEPPRVSIGRSMPSSCADREVQFFDNSVLDTNLFVRKWDFGIPSSGDTLMVPKPKVAYPDTGTFKVKLTVTDSTFCTSTDSIYIDIINKTAPDTITFARLEFKPGTGNLISWKSSKDADALSYTLIKITDKGSVALPMDKALNYTDSLDDDSLGRYHVVVTDTCGNVSEISAPIAKVLLSGDNSVNNVLRLNWNFSSPNNFDSFRVFRKAPSETVWEKIYTIDGSLKTVIDSGACRTTYQYYLEGLTDYGAVSVTNSIEMTTKFSQRVEPLKFYLTTVEGDSTVKLIWERNTHAGQRIYYIDRADNKGIWTIGYDSTRFAQYRDKKAKFNETNYFYRVYAKDYCKNTLPVSNLGASIWLRGNGDKGNVKLKWSEYKEWSANHTYDVEIKFGNSKFEKLASFDETGLSYIDEDLHAGLDTPWCYRIVAVPQNTRTDTSISNIFCDYLTFGVFSPNAFSPNDDGVNDFFIIGGEVLRRLDENAYSDFNLKIIDRWGEVLFESNDPNISWNGQKNGEVVPLGQYWYMLNVKTADGSETNETGPVFVIK